MPHKLLCFFLILCMAVLPCCTGSDVRCAASPEYPVNSETSIKTWSEEDKSLYSSCKNSLRKFTQHISPVLLGQRTENGVCSPISLFFGLALAGAGANDRTKTEILTLLGLTTYPADEINRGMELLDRRFTSDGDTVQLRIHNSVWLDRSGDLNRNYLNTASEQYRASLYSVDFNRSEAVSAAMETWVSDCTEGQFEPQIELDSEDRFAMLNLILYRDAWDDPFAVRNTAEGLFYPEEGEAVHCDFMYKEILDHPYFRGNGYIKCSLGLEYGEMFFILPDEGVSVESLLGRERSVFLPDILSEEIDKRSANVHFRIPKFSFQNNFELTPVLTDLGLGSVFLPNADFSGISSRRDFYIDRLNQQLVFSIDELGVFAAGLTETVFVEGISTETLEFTLNRPFLFGIEAADGVLLFAGVCRNPVK